MAEAVAGFKEESTVDREIFDFEAWRQVFVNSLTELTAPVAAFLPSLVATLFVLGLGWLVSRIVEAAARRALARFGLDRAAERLRAHETLEQAGLSGPVSALVARLLFWVVMLTFLLSAVETLGLSAVTRTLDRLIAFLPRVIASGLILVLGLLVSRLVGNLASSAAAAAGLPEPRRLGTAASGVGAVLVSVVALEQLGVETAVLVQGLTTLIAVFGLTVGATFALGARGIVGHILAGHYLRQSLPEHSAVEVIGRRGTIERVGTVDTLVRDEERLWSIPNARLLEEVMGR
jgi:hypothetical protein